jgi:hypothetical protein
VSKCITLCIHSDVRGNAELEVLRRQLEGREGRYRARGLANADERALALEDLEVALKPRPAGQSPFRRERVTTTNVSLPTPSNTASTPLPPVISSTRFTVFSVL